MLGKNLAEHIAFVACLGLDGEGPPRRQPEASGTNLHYCKCFRAKVICPQSDRDELAQIAFLERRSELFKEYACSYFSFFTHDSNSVLSNAALTL